MTVKELKTELDKYPDDMVVVVDRYSDYGFVGRVSELDAIVVEPGVWARRFYRDEEGRATTFLYLDFA